MKKRSQTRLVRTLGYLVVCLTAGAALLTLAQPPPPPADAPAEGRITPAQAVTDLSTTRLRLWHSVVVHCTKASPPRRHPLLSVAHPGGDQGYHFLVQPDGRIVASNAWRRQEPIGSDRLGLHVALAGGRIDALIPRLQWNAFRELLGQLQQRFRLDPAHIRLSEKSDMHPSPGPPEQAARIGNLLLSAGLSG